jgi:hypothetical protein
MTVIARIITATDLDDCDRVDRLSELNISLQMAREIAKNPAFLVVHNE